MDIHKQTAIEFFRDREAERRAKEVEPEPEPTFLHPVREVKPPSAKFRVEPEYGKTLCEPCCEKEGLEADSENTTVYALFCSDCGKIVPVGPK